jgi:hypothetical protein
MLYERVPELKGSQVDMKDSSNPTGQVLSDIYRI